MNAEQFEKLTGDTPWEDDLERANCNLAGKPGHRACGVCAEHGLPVHKCQPCFCKCHNKDFKYGSSNNPT